MELKIEYIPKEQLKPYANNAKIHTAEQIEQIKKSIEQFGFNDPIAVWHDNEIIEGHGRLLAVMEMDGIEEVPVIRLDNLSDEERRAYMLAHNQLTMNTGFDFALLEEELENLEIDMGGFGFIDITSSKDFTTETESKYTDVINIPQYTPQDEDVELNDLYDTEKYDELISKIEQIDTDENIKQFLMFAAARHIKFNYKNIADYYAKADTDVQKAFEDSALVIIDINDAILNGFTKLKETIKEIRNA